jgi:hypothetical protein
MWLRMPAAKQTASQNRAAPPQVPPQTFVTSGCLPHALQAGRADGTKSHAFIVITTPAPPGIATCLGDTLQLFGRLGFQSRQIACHKVDH